MLMRRIEVLIFFTAIILFFTFCRQAARQDKKIFRYNEQTGIASLDPAFSKNQSIMWAVHQLYNTLVEVRPNLTIKPSLILRYTLDASKTCYTFYLRNDVFFHNDACFKSGKGRKLIADDVVYSFNRIIDKNTASPGAWIFNTRVDSVQPFLALNDSVFQLKLLKPFQPMLGVLSMQYCSIVPKEAVDYYGNAFRSHPVGTGPFAFKVWEEGQALLLTRNENYFEKDRTGHLLPYLDGIKVSFYDNKATEFLEFQQGRLDFINDIDPSFKDEVITKKGELRKGWEGKVQLYKHPYLNVEYLGILADTNNPLLRHSPLNHLKIRQAINYGFDRRKLMLYLRNSIGTPAESGFVPRGLPSFDERKVKGYSYQPENAKQLLKEAGYPDGKGLTVIKLSTIPIYADLAGFIANELKQIGIPIQVDVVQKGLLLEQMAKSQLVFFRGSWIADYPDAENYLSVFYGKNPAPPNYTRYSNALYDALYDKAIDEPIDSIRYGYYQQLDQMMLQDAVVVPLWYDMVIRLVHNEIKGFNPNSLNLLELRTARK